MLIALALMAAPAPVDALAAALAANDSATAALGGWCATRHIAEPATITAAQVKGADALPAPDINTTLGMNEQDEPGYRHVRLSCGGHVLSEAHNWYVPARLSAEMNATLANSDTPFGKVAAPLHFRRERLGEVRGPAFGCPAATVLSHRALLRLPDGAVLALVVECYTPDTLAGGAGAK